ncbi:MAG TPA: transglycosylase domain-containing protein [Acidimicrobiales bacterium]|nr:transglycosylase domain-containing protein [Acidimicrobiales bacterium]
MTGLAGFAYLLLLAPLPPPTVQGQTTFITDASGNRLATIDNGQNRIPVSLKKVPPVVVRAILDTEDHAYYQHGALDPIGIVRAALSDVKGRSLQGGSTIAQQYVKQVYVGTQRTFLRKLREAAAAVRLERQLTKDQILERYLNTIYFGRGAYGIEAASEVYFGRDVSQLGLREGAYLAGLIRSPVTADAITAPAAADRRRNITLDEMVRYRDITPARRAGVEAQPVASYVITPKQEAPQVVDTSIGTQYFVDYVRRVLIQRFGLATVEAGGLRVKTTLNLHTQQQAYDAVYGYLKPWEPAGALVSLDQNGNVVAMVGGRDYSQSQVNLATGTAGGGSGRQAGSTFKLFALATAVHEGYSLDSAFPAPARLVLPKADNGKDYVVNNFQGESFTGKINLIQATVESVNTVYVQLEQQLGVDRLATMARELGIQSPLPRGPSFVLGAADVSVLEMAGAYAAVADGGVRTSPRVIQQVTTSDGRVLWDDEPARTRVLTNSDVSQIDYALRQVVQHGTGTGAQIPGHEVAGKTGTTNNYNDAWFIGYTPTLTTAVWMGYAAGDSHQMLNVRGGPVAGGSLPATIFNRFMSQALAGTDSGTFPPISGFGGRLLTGSSAYYNPPTTSGSGSGSGSSASTTTSTTKGPGGASGSSTTTSSPSSTSTSSTTSTTRPPESTTTTRPATTTTTRSPPVPGPGP